MLHAIRCAPRSIAAGLSTALLAGSAALALGAVPASADVDGQVRDGQARLVALGAQAEAAAERFNAGRIALADADHRATEARERLAREDASVSVLTVQAGAFLARVYMAGPAGQALAVMGTTSPEQLLGQLGVLSSIARGQSDVLTRLSTARTRQAQVSADAQHEQAVAARSLADLQSARQVVEQADQAARATLVQLQAEQARLVQAATDAATRRRAQAVAVALALQAQRSDAALVAFDSQPLIAPVAPPPAAQPTQTAPVPPTAPALPTAPVPPTAPAPSPPAPAGPAPGSAAPPPPAPSRPEPPSGGSAALAALSVAQSELGKPYVYGAAGPDSFDCSGLVMYAYAQAGVSLPHYAAAQYDQGRHVGRGELQPGDLVFFDGLGHVGIYAGNGQFIHAPHTGTVVQYASMAGYWDQNYVGAVRLTD